MKKLLILAIILLTSMGVSYNNTKKVNEKWGENSTVNRIDTNLSEESKERLEKNQQEIEKIINDEKKTEEIVSESTEKKLDENIKQKQNNEMAQIQNDSIPSVNKEPEIKIENAPSVVNSVEKVQVQETPSESVVQETQKNVETPKQITPQQEEQIYCVDGGKTHIAGDGANEHGYYKTWDEAFDAYEKYTEGWESSHFKINQCFCGLYYFSVTE